MKRALKLGQCVRITWDDAVGSDEGWVDAKDHQTVIAGCVTVGKVVRKDRKQIVLAQSWGTNDEQVGNLWAIPRGMITTIEVWK